MKKYKLNKEEVKKINETFDLILADISEIWKLSEVESVSVMLPFSHGYRNDRLEIDDDYIYVKIDSVVLFGDSDICIATRNRNGKFVAKKISSNLALKLIDAYEGVKEEIKEKIVFGSSDKKSAFRRLEEINKRYDKDASVEIDFPTQNQQQLKVTRENGKTIGTLDFGDRTIRVITNGSIVLVNKDEEELERIVAKRK